MAYDMRNYIKTLIFCAAALMMLHPNQGECQEPPQKERVNPRTQIEWSFHESISNMFDTKLPKNYKYRIFPFQFNENTIAYGGEIIATIDGGNPEDKKDFVIKFTQTFGDEISAPRAKYILQKAAHRYESIAQSMNGDLITNEDINVKGFLGKNIYVIYTENQKKYGLRVKIYVTNYGIVEQALIAPNRSIFSYKAEDFFDSISLYDGRIESDAPIGTGWEDHQARTKTFTVTLPPKNSYFMLNAPVFTIKKYNEVMNVVISDPVLENNAFFNISSYKTGAPLTQSNAQILIFKNHIKKFAEKAAANSLNYEATKRDDGTIILKTTLIISPTAKNPHIDTVTVEAQYKGNTMIVQEFISSSSHARSDLAKTLFSLTKFTPENFIGVKEDTPTPPKTEETEETVPSEAPADNTKKKEE